MIFFGLKVSSMQKCSVGTPADLEFYSLILKCGNSYRVELRKDENLKICKDEICRNSYRSGCNKFDFESVGTPTDLDYTIKFSVFKISCTKDFGSLYLNILFFQVFRQE